MGEARFPVAFVGLDPPNPAVAGVTPHRFTPDELVGVDPRHFAAVVLGDAALNTLDPRVPAGMARASGVPFLLCPDQVPGHILVQWERHPEFRMVESEMLAVRLARICLEHRSLREAGLVSLMGLEGTAHYDEPARAALEILPELQPLTVGVWSARLSISRKALWRLTHRAFGMPPRLLLHRYVHEVAQRGRDAGLSLEQLSWILGYSSGSSLRRALHALRAVPNCSGRSPKRS